MDELTVGKGRFAGQAEENTMRLVTCALTTALASTMSLGTFAAHAATMSGTDHDDQLVGTNDADTIQGLEGEDTIFGRGSGDAVYGNDGEDDVRGGPGRDRVAGGDGSDELRPGDGADQVVAGPGADAISVRNDGERDIIYCGKGYDDVYWLDLRDRRDVLRDCERTTAVER